MEEGLSEREKSSIVRIAVLRVLWERGDALEPFSFDDLDLEPSYKSTFAGSVEWLKSEGLIRTGNKIDITDGTREFSSAQLSEAGERFLHHKPEGHTSHIVKLISDAFRDAAKDELSDAIKQLPLIVWTSYEAWNST